MQDRSYKESYKENCVIVDRGFFAQDAHVSKALLELEGIRTFLWYEFHVSLRPLYTVALGGVPVVVHVNDAERALQVLFSKDTLLDSDDPELTADLERLCLEDSVAELAREEAEKQERKASDPPLCPDCASQSVKRNTTPFDMLLLFLILLMPWAISICRTSPQSVLFVAVPLTMLAWNNMGRWRICSDCGASWK